MSELNHKIRRLPLSLAGRIIYACFPYRRRIVKANIEQVFGDTLDSGNKKHLIKAFYSHIATAIKETIQLRFRSDETLRERVEVRGHEHMMAVAAKGRGVLVVTGHVGSWEFAPIGGIANFNEFEGQFHFIRRTLGSKTLERILFRRYFKAGLRVISQKNSLHQVCDALDQNHAVIFVLDQHALLENRDGIAVEFFGKKAGTYRSLATISRYTGVPVVPAAGYRLPNGRHVLEFFEPIPWQDHDTPQESIYQNTLSYNQALERIIMAHPEQWSWLHKRWKLKH